jgi:hypothetical protein
MIHSLEKFKATKILGSGIMAPKLKPTHLIYFPYYFSSKI